MIKKDQNKDLFIKLYGLFTKAFQLFPNNASSVDIYIEKLHLEILAYLKGINQGEIRGLFEACINRLKGLKKPVAFIKVIENLKELIIKGEKPGKLEKYDILRYFICFSM